jgi:hypothetical protein
MEGKEDIDISFDDPSKKDERLIKKEMRESQKPLSAKKMRTLWCLLLSIGINQTLYMNVSSLLPTFAKKNYCISDAQVGIILS